MHPEQLIDKRPYPAHVLLSPPPDELADVTVAIEPLNPGERRICAVITIPQPVEPIWRVLTDYDKLADFLPSVVLSRRVPHPEGKIRLEQVGAHGFLKFHFRARMVLDIEEFYPERIAFNGVEGDFVIFRGAWELHPQHQTTQLCYTVHLRPRVGLPVRLIEGQIRRGVALNLLAIRQRVAQLATDPP
ncbi:MAG: SRPBCC family protein [Gloeomargarita sp. SKYBB_i_bin120]|nr:SRPBCC family protein [Gloeomargarita sp. SKYG98]MCS7293181.1 SRPBCC family protein [Gloeomargarita sp. SKYB120]MDW8178746.1 SRPBCC family protein [Gloeomargarita sp. SKYBB_i_bin120]